MFNWSLRESEANPVDVDEWLMTCGGQLQQTCGGACDQVDGTNHSNNNLKKKKKNGQRQQQQQQGQHDNNDDDEEMRMSNDLAMALQAHAENKRRAMMAIKSTGTTTRSRSLDMAARIHHSFTNRVPNRIPSFLAGGSGGGASGNPAAPLPNSSFDDHHPDLNKPVQVNKKDSILSIHTDSSSSASDGNGGGDRSIHLEVIRDEDDDEYYYGRKRCGRRSSSKCWILICILISIILIAVGLSVALLLRNNKNNSSNLSTTASTTSSSSSDNNDSSSSSVYDDDQQEQFPVGDVGRPGDTEDPDAWIPVEPETEITASPGALEEEDDTDNRPQQDGYDYLANTEYLVGVYYYPWHGG
jgi:hypothetical protein